MRIFRIGTGGSCTEYVFGEHYDDMTALWLQGEYFSFEDGEVRYRTVIATGQG